MPIAEVIEKFDVPQILRGNARFDMDKLQWLNAEYLKTAPAAKFEALCSRELTRSGVSTEGFAPEYVSAALATYREKQQQLIDNPASAKFYFSDDFPNDPEAVKEAFVPVARPLVERLIAELEELPAFTADAIQNLFKPLSKELGVKVGALVHPTRVALTGAKIGPSLYHLMEVLGREKVIQRLRAVLTRIG